MWFCVAGCDDVDLSGLGKSEEQPDPITLEPTATGYYNYILDSWVSFLQSETRLNNFYFMKTPSGGGVLLGSNMPLLSNAEGS